MAQTKDRTKFVFKFHDGTRERKVDVWKTMMLIQAEIPLEVVMSGGQDGRGNAKLLEVFRKSIGVAVWSEENEAGMTDGELLEVLNDFMEFVDVEKKSTEPEPTLLPFTGPKPCDSPSESSSGSGSTSSGS